MLEQVAGMFDNMEDMLKKLKKKSYEERMSVFREKNGHYFTEMTEYVGSAANKEEAVKEIADTFTAAVKERFQVNGKIKGRVQADMNFFMIYFVFPAILLTEHENAKALADGICSKWGEFFKDSKIGYTTYEDLYGAFREKIFGIF